MNACIIAKNQIELDERTTPVFDAFFAGGYAFDEARYLSLADGEKIRSILRDFQSEYENVLFLTERSALPAVKEWAGELYPETAFASADLCVLINKKATLFLLSLEEEGRGVSEVCLPHLAKKYGVFYEATSVRAIGASEARVQALIAEATKLASGKLRLLRRRRYDEDTLYVLYDGNTPKMLVDGVVRLLVEGFGDTMYALNGASIEEQLLTLLKIRGKKLSVAESFTGGGIAKRITSVAGASEVYFEGLNTYDERSKIERLGVSEYTLKTAGAVSDETAYQMALGLLSSGNCDISIATTGLAGPKSDKSMLPVGLCFIAIGTKEKIYVYRYKFEGTRKEITEKAISYALFLAYKKLKDL